MSMNSAPQSRIEATFEAEVRRLSADIDLAGTRLATAMHSDLSERIAVAGMRELGSIPSEIESRVDGILAELDALVRGRVAEIQERLDNDLTQAGLCSPSPLADPTSQPRDPIPTTTSVPFEAYLWNELSNGWGGTAAGALSTARTVKMLLVGTVRAGSMLGGPIGAGMSGFAIQGLGTPAFFGAARAIAAGQAATLFAAGGAAAAGAAPAGAAGLASSAGGAVVFGPLALAAAGVMVVGFVYRGAKRSRQTQALHLLERVRALLLTDLVPRLRYGVEVAGAAKLAELRGVVG